VPQQALARLKAKQAVSATVDAYPGATFTGNIASLNSKVDATSRNVQVRASFANADRRLVPGMYSNVDIDDGDPSTLVTLPQSAITHNPYGDTVYLVQKSGKDDKGNPKLTAVQRFVKLGDTRGDQVAVKSGVAVGDEVVTAGQMKLRNGSPVVINNKIVPSDDPNPTPPNE
jgi:membrane fusion protein (multidrug efflux system)